jgi:hypothetical protein
MGSVVTATFVPSGITTPAVTIHGIIEKTAMVRVPGQYAVVPRS